MTKDEIKKALECCSNPSISYCKGCPYANYGEFDCCNGVMCKAALNLINKQETEIERLKSENEKLKIKCDDLKRLSDWQREEIKMLKAEVNKGCDNCETIKQGQVDVLKELKTRHDYAIKNMGYPWDISQQIDELIKEVESGRYDRHFTPNDNKLEIIVVKELQEVEK